MYPVHQLIILSEMKFEIMTTSNNIVKLVNYVDILHLFERMEWSYFIQPWLYTIAQPCSIIQCSIWQIIIE